MLGGNLGSLLYGDVSVMEKTGISTISGDYNFVTVRDWLFSNSIPYLEIIRVCHCTC